jgi:VWA domain-containing protein
MFRPLAPRVLAGLLVFAAGSGLLARQEPQFRAGTDTIPIYATVLDESGRLVTDLTRDDFEVRDNGRPQKLTTFSNADLPITVVMMLDRSGSVEAQFATVERAAAEFVNQLGPADRARIGSFSTKIRIDPPTFTSDHDTLLTVLRHDLQPFGPTPLWNATDLAVSAVTAETGRRVVLVFTDGKDLPVDDGPNVSFDQIRTRVETEDVMVYGIGLGHDCPMQPFQFVVPKSPDDGIVFQRGGRGGGGRVGGMGRGGPVRVGPRTGGRPGGGGAFPIPLPPRVPNAPGFPPTKPPVIFDPARSRELAGCSASKPDPHLRALTTVGGGGYFELTATDDMNATFTRVADELHRQYLLAYVAPEHDGALHHLEVIVHRPDVTVRARAGYVAPK